MPEIYRGPAHLQKKTTLIGEGSEHDVYRREDGKVVKEKSLNSQEFMNTPQYLRAEFYLTKIAHLLFPDSIPNIHAMHFSGKKGEAQTIHTHIDTSSDQYHEDVRRSWVDPNYPIPKYELIQDELAQRADIVSPFQSELEDSGIILFDRSLQNYVVTPTSIQYIDRFYPIQWDAVEKQYISIDIDKIRQAVEKKITDPNQKHIASQYITRLEHFLKEIPLK